MVLSICLALDGSYKIALPEIVTSAIVAMTLSIVFLSFAFGPMIFGPLSEMYGRTWVKFVSNGPYLCC